MKKKIILLTLISLIITPLLEACTFTILNNSPYEEIFVTDKEHLANIVNRKTLMEVHLQAAKQSNQNPEQPVEEAIRISKSMKKNAAKGQITGRWFDIYVPYYPDKRTYPVDPPAQFKKAYRVSINYCHDDNYITYKNIEKAAAQDSSLITQTEQKRKKDGKRLRFEVVDFNNPKDVARAHTLIGSHASETHQNNNKTYPEAKPAKVKLSKKRTKKERSEKSAQATEFLEPSKQQRPIDTEFNEFMAYPGGNPEDFQGYIP